MIERDWLRPALHKSEAVMMPALGHRRVREPLFSDRNGVKSENAFVPVPQAVTTTALSTYVRPRGSMAGRSVLRAAGVSLNPYASPKRSRQSGAARGFGGLRRFLWR